MALRREGDLNLIQVGCRSYDRTQTLTKLKCKCFSTMHTPESFATAVSSDFVQRNISFNLVLYNKLYGFVCVCVSVGGGGVEGEFVKTQHSGCLR